MTPLDAPITILVADEDEATRRFVCDNLLADGFEVLDAADAPGALLALRHVPDAAICDLNGSTLGLVDAVRGSAAPAGIDPATPLLLLTGAAAELDRIRAYDRGADDVLCKPFSYPELVARLRALLRRSRSRLGEGPLRVGPLEIDRTARRATLDGDPLELSAKEYGLLIHLAAEPRRVFTKAELLRDVWGFRTIGRTRTLDSHACRLRRKLEVRGEQRFVVNVWGVGYRLVD
jgi:DNA-binding response OmpR family regulator